MSIYDSAIEILRKAIEESREEIERNKKQLLAMINYEKERGENKNDLPKIIAPCKMLVDTKGSIIDENDCVSNDQGSVLFGHIELSFDKESIGWVMIKDHSTHNMKTYDSFAFSSMLRTFFLQD